MNRPFAILKDLLPPREKPAADRRQPAHKKPGQGRRHGNPAAEALAATGATPATLPMGDTSPPAAAAVSPRQPGKGGNPQRSGTRRPKPPRPAHDTASPSPQAAAGIVAPTTPPDPEQARKAAERAAKQRALADEGLAALVAAHPHLFNRQQPVPLAIGIHKPLLEAAKAEQLAASVAAVRAAIGRWTSSRQYLAVMLEDATRVNLAGEPEGVVTAEQAEAAKTWLEKRQARYASKPRGGKGKGQGKRKPHDAKPGTANAAGPATPAQPPAADAQPAPAEQQPTAAAPAELPQAPDA